MTNLSIYFTINTSMLRQEYITTDLNLLSSKVTKEPSSSASGFAMLFLLGNLKWISPESYIGFLADQDIDRGSIFQSNGSKITMS